MKHTQSLNSWKKAVIASAFTALVVGGYTFNSSKATAMAEPLNLQSEALVLGPPSFAALVKQVKPAVVNIAITGKISNRVNSPVPDLPENSPFYEFFKHFQQPGFSGPNRNTERNFQAVGSGFFISRDGYVVTNNHVIENADNIFVITQDGKKRKAILKGKDPKTDLALLKVDDGDAFPYVELGDSANTEVGEWVIAVGNPFGLGGTVTAGIISAHGRDIQAGPYDDYIQIDAPINRGNSGGPLFDNKGQVIGINTAIYSPTGGNVGIAFAIPSNLAKNVVEQLKDSGSVARGWLGVQIQGIDALAAQSLGLDKEQGVLVADVIPDSPAEKAGIQIGDVILSMDGAEFKTSRDLLKFVAQAKSGKQSSIELIRQGKIRTLGITVSEPPESSVELAQGGNKTPKNNGAKLGVYLSELTHDSRRQLGIPNKVQGVLVTSIEPNSPAEKAGIYPGDVISMVGQESVDSPRGVIDKVQQAAKKKNPSVLLLVENRSGKRFVSVEFATT